MKINPYILLADDDPDDCMFFREALEALSVSPHQLSVNNGEKLMNLLLSRSEKLPDILFLDLNMPRKDGFECLLEIKNNKELEAIPVVIISTSYDSCVADELWDNGASYYIQKPIGFSQLQELIELAIDLVVNKGKIRPEKNSFLLR